MPRKWIVWQWDQLRDMVETAAHNRCGPNSADSSLLSPPISIYASKRAWILATRSNKDASSKTQIGKGAVSATRPFHSASSQLHSEFECTSSLSALPPTTATDRCSCCRDPHRFRRLKFLKRILGYPWIVRTLPLHAKPTGLGESTLESAVS